jgi:hypothetical protein
MKHLILLCTFALSMHSFSQNIPPSEIGVDGSFYASNFGGTIGLGVKYGLKLNENVIAGPSVRYQRSWAQPQFSPNTSSFNVFGGGGFLHARFFNALFVGTELEFLRSPFSGGFVGTTGNWSFTALIGGGYSMEFNEKWRLNLGIMYDVVNSLNSPLRTQYFMRNAQQQLLPVIYRITFFFPLGGSDNDGDDFDEE